jgi:hypothetical protein
VATRLFGEDRRCLPLGPDVDAFIGPALFPVIQIRQRSFQALESIENQFKKWLRGDIALRRLRQII